MFPSCNRRTYLCAILLFSNRFLALFMARSELNVIILLIQQHRARTNTQILRHWRTAYTEQNIDWLSVELKANGEVSSNNKELCELRRARPSRKNKLKFICIYWYFPTFCFSQSEYVYCCNHICICICIAWGFGQTHIATHPRHTQHTGGHSRSSSVVFHPTSSQTRRGTESCPLDWTAAERVKCFAVRAKVFLLFSTLLFLKLNKRICMQFI